MGGEWVALIIVMLCAGIAYTVASISHEDK